MNDEKLKSAVDSRLTEIKQNYSSVRHKRQRQMEQFENKVKRRWGKPLELMELQIETATNACADPSRQTNYDPHRSTDYVIEALIRLHVRACRVSREILLLLHSGYADGALARWRTLHEIAVIAAVIRKFDNDIAKKYLLHDVVEYYKTNLGIQKALRKLGQEPPIDDEFDKIEPLYNRRIRKFGSSFKNRYGWAASVTKSKNPTMYDLEQLTDNDDLRPFVGMANDNVHVNAYGDHNRLATSLLNQKVLLGGPSNSGLKEPGILTARSLGNMTSVLLKTKSSSDRAITGLALMDLVDEITEAFQTVEKELEAQVDAFKGK